MKRLNFWLLCFLSFVLSGSLYAQNLTGIWRGTFYNPAEIAMGGSKYRYEVQINNNGREAKGVTYSYQTTRFYGKASMVGVWSSSSKNLVLQEDDMLDLKITGGGDGCLMTCYLTYKKEDGKEYLEGTYTSYNMNNKNQNCGGGRVFLEKVPDTDFELEDFLLKKTPEKSTPKVKPGQEDFLVKKPENNTTKPPAGAAKPPASGTKPPATTPKTSSSAAKPPASKPPASTAKTPTPGAKPPAAKPPVSSTKPPATATKPPATATKPPATQPKTTTAGTKPPVTPPKTSTANTKSTATPPKTTVTVPSKPPAEPEKVTTETVKKNTEPVKPNPSPVVPPPPILKERKNELFKTITTNKRMIEVSFYDNGEIDGDTISVYNNNHLIASKKGLSAKPVVIKVELSDDNPEQDVVMVAENLGRIPPNTALMIVMAGDERFTVYLNSSEQKNAMVRFKYQP